MGNKHQHILYEVSLLALKIQSASVSVRIRASESESVLAIITTSPLNTQSTPILPRALGQNPFFSQLEPTVCSRMRRRRLRRAFFFIITIFVHKYQDGGSVNWNMSVLIWTVPGIFW